MHIIKPTKHTCFQLSTNALAVQVRLLEITFGLSHFKNHGFQGGLEDIREIRELYSPINFQIRCIKPYTLGLIYKRYVSSKGLWQEPKQLSLLDHVVQMEKLRALRHLMLAQPYSMSVRNHVNFGHVGSQHVDFVVYRFPACQSISIQFWTSYIPLHQWHNLFKNFL